MRARLSALLVPLARLALLAACPAPASAEVELGRAILPLDRCSAPERLNVRLACERLREVEVGPREEFHFMTTLGERGGPPQIPGRALFEGQSLEESGGGLCAVAGAVHAAALRASLGVIERAGHSARVKTLPRGLDAAVSESGRTDLVLWNPYSFAIRLHLRMLPGAAMEARWTAPGGVSRASIYRDRDGALVRRLPDGREEILDPAPSNTMAKPSLRR